MSTLRLYVAKLLPRDMELIKLALKHYIDTVYTKDAEDMVLLLERMNREPRKL